MALRQYSGAVTTTGEAGSATGTGSVTIPTHGHIEYIYIDYHASAHANTDVTVAYASTPPGGNILVVSNNKTDALYFPRASCVTNANGAITDSYTKFPVAGNLSLAVADSTALTACVTVYVGVST